MENGFLPTTALDLLFTRYGLRNAGLPRSGALQGAAFNPGSLAMFTKLVFLPCIHTSVFKDTYQVYCVQERDAMPLQFAFFNPE